MAHPELRQALSLDDLKALQQAVLGIYVDPALVSYAVALATATREPAAHGLGEIAPYIAYGASPRGPISVVQAARALALLRGRDYALAEDIQSLARDALAASARAHVPGARRGGEPRHDPRSGARGRAGTADRPCSDAGRLNAAPLRLAVTSGDTAEVRLPLGAPSFVRAGELSSLARMGGRAVHEPSGAAPGNARPPGARSDARSAACARSTSASGGASRACSRATTGRRCTGRAPSSALVRPYVPGDDVRRIDWNVTARTSEPHVRVTLAERVLVSWLVLDTSVSMQFGTADRRKADVAEGVAIAVGHLATRRGNRLGVVTFGDASPRALPPRQGRRGSHRPPDCPSRRRGRGTAPGTTSLGEALKRTNALARQRSLVVVVSDFRGRRDWRRRLLELASRHDVVAVEIRDPREQELVERGRALARRPRDREPAARRHA